MNININQSRVVILLLNWNGWKDTIECLESVFRLDYPSFRVVVCDNGSTDGSLEKIKQWADGQLEAPKFEVALKSSNQSIIKPIPYVEYNRLQAETAIETSESAPLVLIQTGANLGFAGGNNVGLRYCMARDDVDYMWVLNNDTVVEPDALTCMMNRLHNHPELGMCGSKLIFYHQPTLVQAWGGATFDASRGVVMPLGIFQPVDTVCDQTAIEEKMAYVMGASMLVRRDFIKDIGLMCEDYFLYFEEIDWAFRAHGRYGLAYSADSLVYHKEGGSIGSSSLDEPSALSTRYLYRNRVRFNQRYNRTHLIYCLSQIGYELLVLLKRRHFKTAWTACCTSLTELIRIIRGGKGHAR